MTYEDHIFTFYTISKLNEKNKINIFPTYLPYFSACDLKA